jgi:glyceraldehyde-3-phosphate dehydrogenase/erythrose-4-phosphate dehydrogenase
MPVRVGINGFGRMGRLALRGALNNPSMTPSITVS